MNQWLLRLLMGLLLFCSNSFADNSLDIHFYQKPLDELRGHAYDVEEDKNGYLWISTAYGIKRYDGQSLIDFIPPGAEDLKSRQTHELTIVDNNLWISTTMGVARVDLDSYEYVLVEKEDKKHTISDDVILNMKKDNSDRLWMTSYNGVTLYEAGLDQFTPFPIKHPDIDSAKKIITTNIADNDIGEIWVGSAYDGLFLLNPLTGEFNRYLAEYIDNNGVKFKFTKTDKISDLYVTKDGLLLVSVQDKLVSISGKEITAVRDFEYKGETLTPNIIQEDHKSNVWLTFKSRGLAKLTGDQTEYLVEAVDQHGLPNKKIYNFTKDRLGNLIAIYIDEYPRFYNLINDEFEKINLSSDRFNKAIDGIIGQNGSSIYAYSNNTIVKINTESEELTYVYQGNKEVGDAVYINEKEIWAIVGRELIKLNPETGKTTTVSSRINYLEHHPELGVFGIMVRSYYLINNKTGEARKFDLPNPDSSISKPYSDPSTGIWFVASNNIYFLNKNGRLKSIPYQSEYSYSGAPIIYRDGVLWVFGNNGFEKIILSTRSETYEVIGSEKFPILKNNVIGSAVLATDFIWFSSLDGKSLFKLDIESNHYKSIGAKSGLLGGNPIGSIAYIGENLLLTQGESIYRISEQTKKLSIENLPLKVSSIVVQNNQQIENYIYDTRKKLILEPEDKFITINFSDNSIENLGALGVQLKLEGRDEDWHNAAGNYAIYSALSPGEYTFKLRSKFLQQAEYQLDIEVIPPWWRSYWAYAIYSLMVILALGLYYYLWLQKNKIKKESYNKIKIYAQGFEHAAEGFCVVDQHGNIQAKNLAFDSITRPGVESLLELRPRSYDSSYFGQLWKQLIETGHWFGQTHIRGRYEEEVAIECVASKVDQDNELENRYVLLISDITLKLRQEEELRRLANYDRLTGLANRNLFNDNLKQAVKNADHLTFSKFALFVIGIDRFKWINDSFGHEFGDDLLKSTSERINSCIREQDSIARLGGDEFCVILENIEDVTRLAQLAKKIIEVVELPIKTQEENVSVTVSIGVSIYKTDSLNPETLLSQANAALKSAKEDGGGKFQFYTESMNSKLQNHIRLESDMRKAVKNSEFISYFQPKVCLKSGKVIGAEALVRWRRDKQKIQSPDSFIETAEKSGVINKIGSLVLRDVCLQLQSWWEIGVKIPVAVNLSAQQIIQDNFVDMIEEIISQYDFDRYLLEFEITEHLLMNDREKSIAVLKLLRDKGHSIYIDDFGTGYSSLSYLADFPIDYLKIDQVFIKDLLVDDRKKSIVHTIVELANNLSLKVVAEGVEEKEVHQYLKELGCQFAQGFYYCHPLSAKDLMETDLFVTSFGLSNTEPNDA
ncbi:EAL domain-containing protein [uncultured Pseudoteredinibacter sp.]|uniref:EAL domain-containing protein n=1 Tax=uncultured Pseudoteredinibacter sp. TaxID=1641701 RepID=UPI00261E9653|nr:EAL domain-containing protein [uncultured Pseudoteredinibacter sp.]